MLAHPILFATPRRLTVGSTWHDAIPFGMLLVSILRPNLLVELGTQGGDSYCAFCQAVESLQLPTRCYAIDTWRGDPHAGTYGDEVLEDLRTHHDSLYGSFSNLIQGEFDACVGRFSDGSIDLLHIDGYHTHEAVRHDFETWLPKMSDRGVVLLHDTNIRDRGFGVWRLWDELEGRFPRFELPHGHGLGVICVGSGYPADFEALLADGEVAAPQLFEALGERVTLLAQSQTADHGLEAQRKIIRVLENQRDEQHARADALEGEIAALRDCVAELSERATQAEAQVSAFLATKTFRYTTPVRRAYLKLRSASQKSSTLASVRRRIAFQGGAGTFQEVRQALATHHLRGEGLEIGALHQPLTVPSEATVRYVDRLTVEELREHYPELAQYDLVEPDLIDDGERLSSVSDSSVDFVIANHFIEHCEDPIGALSNLLRVTRTGGIVYMAVPDKRRIFDRERPETTIEHLDRDHRDGPGWSKERHYDEYARLVDHAADPAAHARQLRERDYSIHFHVWTPTTFEEFVDHCRRVHRLPFEVAEFVPDNDFEFIAILRKTDGQIQNLQP